MICIRLFEIKTLIKDCFMYLKLYVIMLIFITTIHFKQREYDGTICVNTMALRSIDCDIKVVIKRVDHVILF